MQTCAALPLKPRITVTRGGAGLGYRAALSGQSLAFRVQTRSTQRQSSILTVAVLPSPAALSAVGRMAVRLAPGKLLLRAFSKPGMARLATPLSFALLAYSIGITLYAALKKSPTQSSATATAQGQAYMSIDTDSCGSGLESMDLSDNETTAPSRRGRVQLCKLCDGKGTISYEAKFLHEDEPCPCCLGRGFVSRK